jgi:hypothetical protein
MTEHVLETLTLRERLRDAERLSRELSEHLEQGLIPKLQQLRRLSKVGKETEGEGPEGPVADASIRTAADAALNSHEYLLDLSRKLDRYLSSAERELDQIVTGNQPDLTVKKRT